MNQQTTNRDTGEAAATNAPANSATSTSTPDNQPTPLDAFEVLLITGMSGAGRSHAADCVEDMGWYVVDNLPPKLLIPLVDMMTTSGSGSESGVHKLAAVIDVRSSYFDELAAVLGHLDDLGVKTRILFLDASNEVLIKRYESVRRPHPLQHGNRLIDGLAVGALAGTFAGRTGGAHELEHAFDGVGILECHALGATQRAMLGLDA